MTRDEAIKYLRQIYPNGGHCWLDSQRIEAIEMAIMALSQPSLPSNLDEAAKEIATDILGKDYLSELDEDCAIDALNEAITLVKAGVEWMAGQGWLLDGEVKDQPTGGDDFEIYLDYDGNKMEDILDEICDYVNANYPDDDNRYKVVVQIRKK